MNKKSMLFLTSTGGIVALVTCAYLIKQYQEIKKLYNEHLNSKEKSFYEKKQLIRQKRIQEQHQRQD